jgi:hypothetical protein
MARYPDLENHSFGVNMGTIHMAGYGLLVGAFGQIALYQNLFSRLPKWVALCVLLPPWLIVYTISFCRRPPFRPPPFPSVPNREHVLVCSGNSTCGGSVAPSSPPASGTFSASCCSGPHLFGVPQLFSPHSRLHCLATAPDKRHDRAGRFTE